MALGDSFRRLFDLLAGMGLILTDDKPKVIELRGREWGPTVNGLALSIANSPETLSVVLRNVSTEPVSFSIPTWLEFYQVITDAPLSAYGEMLRKSSRQGRVNVALKPGEPTEAEIPVRQMFADTRGRRFQVVCEMPDGVRLESNVISGIG